VTTGAATGPEAWSDAETGAIGEPDRKVVNVDGTPMSALVISVPQPRAVVVAVHGGAVTSAYYDATYPGPHLSLLRVAAALGYTAIALDRPGYGSSAAHQERMSTPDDRVSLAYRAIERLLDGRPRGAGIFLVGHSIGCALVVRMAADPRGSGTGFPGTGLSGTGLSGTGSSGTGLSGSGQAGTGMPGTGLLGLEIAGIGLSPHPEATFMMPLTKAGGPGSGGQLAEARPPEGGGQESRRTGVFNQPLQDALWKPRRLYPPRASLSLRYSMAPAYEGGEVRGWVGAFPALAATVRVPVHYTLGDHERIWSSGPAALAQVGALFTASPRVVTAEQPDAAHNLSLGWTALSYHLKVLSFLEECIVAREHGN
jgi:pimeloyl-ACP methyl ester carboxylesterase